VIQLNKCSQECYHAAVFDGFYRRHPVVRNTLCERLFACGDKSFAAVSICTDNLLPSNIPPKCIIFDACYFGFNVQTCYIVATLMINCIKCRERGKGGVVTRKV
jgi:hypothetical protein